MKKKIAVLFIMIVLLTNVYSQGKYNNFNDYLSFSCSYEVSIDTVWEESQKDTDLEPELNKNRKGFKLVFNSFNREGNAAKLIGNIDDKSEQVLFLPSNDVLVFIEILGSGVVQITHIYNQEKSEPYFKSVHSRHTFLGGSGETGALLKILNPKFKDEILAAQYFGYCNGIKY